jgi:NADPH:quinone reductase-like Zn-dependent oxidoreductase
MRKRRSAMRAVIFQEFGGPDVLATAEVPTPEPRNAEVLIRIEAAGLNRLDHYVREGSVTRNIPLPHILGSDASGVVEVLGPGVSGFAVGDRVIPMPGYPLDEGDAQVEPLSTAPSYAIRGIAEQGAYAQFMTVPARWLVRDDTGLSPEQVATLPMPLVTAVRAVKVVGRVAQGEFVLVHAGASGTGSMNIQIARALGARVATTVRSKDKARFVEDLGAELIVELDDPAFATRISDWTSGAGVHAVIDNLGGEILPRSLQVMRPLGRLVSMGMVAGLESTIQLRPLFFAQQQILGTLMGDVGDLKWGLEQVRAGKIKPLVDEVFPLDQASAAHARLAAGSARGNLVLQPWA